MLTDPEEGHYSKENKAGRAFRCALFTLDIARRDSHLLRTVTQRRLFKLVHTIERKPESQSYDSRHGGHVQRRLLHTPPLTAAQCWADAGTEEGGGGDGGGRLVRRQSCASVLASVRETPRHSFYEV